MIILRRRNEIIQTKQIISSELTKVQRLCFDENVLQYYKNRGEEHLFWEEFDCINNKIIGYDSFDKVTSMNYTDIRIAPIELTSKLKEVLKIIAAKKFIMLSSTKRDFFGDRNNGFEPLMNAYMKLEKITGLKSYKEALVFDLDDLFDVINVLFWASNYDASFPEYVFLFDQEEQIQISLSHHGNIYFREFGKERLTDKVITTLGLTVVDQKSAKVG